MTDLALIHRISSRFIEAVVFPRETYVPKEHRDKPPLTPEGTDLVIWTWEENGIPYGVAFVGKAKKPLWNYRFKSDQQRQKTIDDAIASRKRVKEYKDQKLKERREYQHPYKIGDIFDTSWGYDQTNVDFYQVIEVRGKVIVVREISKAIAREASNADYVVPVKDSFTGPPIRVIPSMSDSIKIEGHYASIWDGKPAYQTAFGTGH